MVSSDHLGPGEEGTIRAVVDTRRKRGRIVKTVQVQTNDPEKPLVVLRLTATVKDPYHGVAHEAEAIFRTPCRSCHVDRGMGRTGAALYRADCMMCHRRGRLGKDITELKKLTFEQLRDAIENGIEGSVMPGFSSRVGGPLTQAQIRSLIRYIKGH
ncbi:MAG: DUF1573 domain-containing protein [Nitrospirae bacterium]|nr:MAG: DUF1573 domain-containing protein [Nitrospirota bacterium]